MAMPFPKNPWLKAASLTALGGFLVAAACWGPSADEAADVPIVELPAEVAVKPPPSPAPIILTPPTPEEIRRRTGPAMGSTQDLSQAPTFTPYTLRPDIKNRSEIAQALEREYPRRLRNAGVGGTVQVWFFIDAEGEVQRLQVKESSGQKALDDAALRVAGSIDFTPARNRDEAVPVWIALPITFASKGQAKETPLDAFKHFLAVTFEYFGDLFDRLLKRDVPVEKAEKVERAVEATPVVLPPEPTFRGKADIAQAPTFTPYTVRPDIRNRSEVTRALEEAYPPLLRDAGIEGTTQVWLFIDEAGVVQKTQVNKSSGHQALDEAALEVAGVISFTPAMNRDKTVPVWISLPITFSVR